MEIPSGAEILFVRFKSLGDILLSLPLANELKRRRPDVSIDYLVDDRFAGVAALSTYVRAERIRPRAWSSRLAMLSALRARYDLVVDLHGSPAAAIMARIASRGTVAGYDGKRFAGLYSHRITVSDEARHTVEINMGILESFDFEGPFEAAWSLRVDRERGERIRKAHGEYDVILHPGARFAHKLWPGDRFRAVADELENRGHRVAVIEGPSDIIPSELARYPRLANLAPSELLAALAASRLFIGNDSGPMHFAAAAGIPTIGLFGPSDAVRWHPYSPCSAAVSATCLCGLGTQRPCAHPDQWCMKNISVADVLTAVDRLDF